MIPHLPGKDRKPLRRQVGHGLIVEVSVQGVTLRYYNRRKRVTVTWEQLAKQGLLNARYNLTDEEWGQPLDTLERLSQLPPDAKPIKERRAAQAVQEESRVDEA